MVNGEEVPYGQIKDLMGCCMNARLHGCLGVARFARLDACGEELISEHFSKALHAVMLFGFLRVSARLKI